MPVTATPEPKKSYTLWIRRSDVALFVDHRQAYVVSLLLPGVPLAAAQFAFWGSIRAARCAAYCFESRPGTRYGLKLIEIAVVAIQIGVGELHRFDLLV